MKRGFTLIELLVASLLLGMLVMILTSIFSQSSIAWSTGLNGAADMRDARKEMSNLQRTADTLLDGNGTRTQSLFTNGSGDNTKGDCFEGKYLNKRAYETKPIADGYNFQPTFDNMKTWTPISVGGAKKGGTGVTRERKQYVVGVWSYGPDGEPHTWDDVTTWPAD